jgi:hypothetical protein
VACGAVPLALVPADLTVALGLLVAIALGFAEGTTTSGGTSTLIAAEGALVSTAEGVTVAVTTATGGGGAAATGTTRDRFHAKSPRAPSTTASMANAATTSVDAPRPAGLAIGFDVCAPNVSTARAGCRAGASAGRASGIGDVSFEGMKRTAGGASRVSALRSMGAGRTSAAGAEPGPCVMTGGAPTASVEKSGARAAP